jgi:hypothetical protein
MRDPAHRHELACLRAGGSCQRLTTGRRRRVRHEPAGAPALLAIPATTAFRPCELRFSPLIRRHRFASFLFSKLF